MGNFALALGVVYSNETITKDAVGTAIGNSQVGRTSGGVPKWRYNISPRYAFGDTVVGATVRGQGQVFADGNNTTTIDGHYIVNAFVNHDFGNGLSGSLNISNLFDNVYPANGAGFVGGSTTVLGAGVETGRAISATVRYSF